MKKLYRVEVSFDYNETVMVVADSKSEAEDLAGESIDTMMIDWDAWSNGRECEIVADIPSDCLNDAPLGIDEDERCSAAQYLARVTLLALGSDVPDTRQLHLMDRGADPRPADETDALCAEYARLLVESHAYAESDEETPTAMVERMVELSKHPLVMARLADARERDFGEAGP